MRTEFLLGLISGVTAISGCTNSNQAEKKENNSSPNIIFIYSDDLGIGDLSCYGATKIHTPHIDSLADNSLRFTNAYATSATSTPSRFGLLTGVYPWRKSNTGIAPGNSGLIIDTESVTLADMFKNAGYTTGVVGKWHLGLGGQDGPDFNTKISPNTQDLGFDYEFIIPATVDRVPCVYIENGRVVNLDPNDPIQVDYKNKVGNRPTGEENPELARLKPSQGHNNTIINGIPRIGYMAGGESALWVDEDIADTLVSKAKQFIANNKDNPFFLYMGTQDVHVPRIPHPRFKGKSGLGDRGDVILQLDWTIGEIMHTLDSLNLLDNTLVIFTSDNGPVIDDGYQDEALERLNGHTPMGEYRGGKYSVFEAGTRIPFIISWRNKIAKGVQPALFSQIDIFASFAKLLNQNLGQGVAPDSKDALNILLGTDNTNRDFVVQQNLDNTLAIIKNDWKYIETSDAPPIEFWTKIELGNSTKPQLYNLKEDAAEQNNLASTHPEKTERLSFMLDSVKQLKTTFK